MKALIDLRSDTVTQPPPSMRRAMASAEVGDDVYGEDPTTRALEEHVAALLNTEAALFVPSGTMGNQVAIHLHTRPGSEVIGEAGSHVFNFEMGAMAALSGALPRPVVGDGGLLSAAAVTRAIQPDVGYATPTKLLVLENTHNLAGGRVTPPARTAELVAAARARGLAVHLDGARLLNAAAALGVAPAALTVGCDTVMLCLSKGLAAPVGSALAGSRPAMKEARRIRKMFGGGMRQCGVLAAAGLVALDEMAPRIGDDNRRCRRLAEGLARHPAVDLDLAAVETNIVFFGLTAAAPLDVTGLVRGLAEAGILATALGPDRLRMVTHYHVDDGAVDRVIAAATRLLDRR